MYGLFDSKFPAVVFHSEPCARYGDKSFAKFEAESIALVNDLDDADTPLARLLAKLAVW